MQFGTDVVQERDTRRWAERLIVPVLITGILATAVWCGTIGVGGWWLAHTLLIRMGLA